MMIECPKPVYDRLVSSGLADKIFEKKEALHDVFLYKDPAMAEQSEEILAEAESIRDSPGKITEKYLLCKDISDFFSKAEQGFSHLDFQEKVLENPGFIAYLALGDELLDYREYGFPCRKSLEQAVASYCIGESHLFDSSSYNPFYVWRNNDYKNQILQNVHGDMSVSQTEVSGEERREMTLFGERISFDTFLKDPARNGIAAYQDWTEFLYSTLRYAEAIGKADIHEIVNWEQVLEEVGAVHNASAESMFGGDGIDFQLHMLNEAELLKERKGKPEKFPLGINYLNEHYYIPYLREENLLWLQKDEEGEIEIDLGQIGKRFRANIEYTPEDLPNILRATYRLFARDRSRIPAIMQDFFYDQNPY